MRGFFRWISNIYGPNMCLRLRVISNTVRGSMNFFSKLFGRRRGHSRVDAHLRVTISTHDEHYWTEDISVVGFRMKIGRQLSLANVTGGNREVPLLIEMPDGEPVKVFGEPIWAVRTDDGQLSTGWRLSRYDLSATGMGRHLGIRKQKDQTFLPLGQSERAKIRITMLGFHSQAKTEHMPVGYTKP